MASRYEVEVTIISANNLKNVNWRHGKLTPYAVVWLDRQKKCSTRADDGGDASPYWDDKLLIPFNSPIDDSTLFIDIVHANAADDTKPLIGSAKLPLRDVGLGSLAELTLELKRPSGRPQGQLDVKVSVCEPRYRTLAYGAPAADHVPRDYDAATPYGNPYGGPAAYGTPLTGYPAYGAPASYGQPSYEQGGLYGQQQGYVGEEKKSKFGGMGTGLAVGAVAGAVGGLALAEGFDALEDKIADDVEDQVDDDLGYGGDD